MFEFVVVAKPRPIPEGESRSMRLRYSERSILSEEDHQHTLEAFGGKAMLLGRSNFEHQGPPVASDQYGFTCLDGYLVSGHLANRSDNVVSQLRHLLFSSEDRAWLSDCLGEFLVVHYDTRRRSLEFLLSELRTVPLYLREDEDTVCVSNRASLCNVGFEEKPTLDLLGQLHHVASETPLGDDTAFEEVSFLPRDRSAALRYAVPGDRPGTPELVLSEREWTWADPGAETPTMEKALEQTGPVTEWLTERLHLFREQVSVRGGESYLLSGGKDSRLMLALLSEGGLLDLYDGARTFGLEGEIEAATPVAVRYGLEHEISTWQTRPPGGFFGHLAGHVFSKEGEVNCMDLSGELPRGDDPLPLLKITGQEGSSLRKEPYRGAEKVISDEDARHYLLEGFPIDPVGLLPPEVVRGMRSTLIEDYERALGRGTKPENYANLRRITQRLPRWAGKNVQARSPAVLTANFLCSPPLFVLAHNMGPLNRRRELLHLGMLSVLDSGLLKYPFFEQGWHPDIMAAFGERYRLPTSVVENADAAKRRAGAWYTTLHKNNGRSLARTISDLAHPDTQDLIDYEKLMGLLGGNRPIPIRHLKSILGAISVNLLLHAGDVSREGVSRMQAVLEVAEKNFENPDSPPAYFTRKIHDTEDVVSENQEIKEEKDQAIGEEEAAAGENGHLRRSLADQKRKTERAQARVEVLAKQLREVSRSRGWRLLTLLSRARKKLTRS